MNLQELMGEAYKEDLTAKEISDFLETKKLADLSTGKYVNKESAEASENLLKKQLKEKDTLLKDKMSSEDLTKQEKEEKEQEIERLKGKLLETEKVTNKSQFTSLTAESRLLTGLKAEDNGFIEFMDIVINDDSDNTVKIGTYLSKILKEAYEKGKNDSTKDNLGNLGKANSNSGNGKISLGEQLAKSKNKQAEKYDYFSKK
ncbi:MAG: hypothetical protein RR708_04405 [Bacilli bacterium]